MFYRRKILLALLQSFDGKLEKIAFQKLLFLFSNRQILPVYAFIPYHFGSYSISANADLTAMVRAGQIEEHSNCFKKLDANNFLENLTYQDQQLVREIREDFGDLNSKSLMRYTYLNFCYYAINSKTAKEILTSEEYQKVLSAHPRNRKTILYTIGYEGIALEDYLNQLIKHDVKVLVDVRSNPFSMKFGFSKNQLKYYCENLSIEYMHIPEVGIRSEYRQGLKHQNDYDKLFKKYEKETLVQTRTHQEAIFTLLKTKKRIALTCFEAEINRCHRNLLAKSITDLPDWEYQLQHL